MANQTIRNAARYAERQLGFGKPRFYAGLFGLLAVAIAFAALAAYAAVVADAELVTVASSGSALMTSVVVWRVWTWSQKADD